MPGTVRLETIARYSDDTKAPFSCNQCPGRAFQSPRGLMTHVQNLHYPGRIKRTGRYECHCGKSYTQSSNLRLHQRKIHGAPIKPVGRPRAEAIQPRFPDHGVKYCPCCGTNVAVVQAAMNLCNGRL